MRENRLSGLEGGATLIQSSLPLSFIPCPRDEGRFFERSVIRFMVNSCLEKRKALITWILRISNLIGPGIDIRGFGNNKYSRVSSKRANRQKLI